MSMIHSANIFIKFQKHSRKEGGHFSLDQYFQPLNQENDSPNNIAFNAYEQNVEIKKGISDNYKDIEKLLWDEINMEDFGLWKDISLLKIEINGS